MLVVVETLARYRPTGCHNMIGSKVLRHSFIGIKGVEHILVDNLLLHNYDFYICEEHYLQAFSNSPLIVLIQQHTRQNAMTITLLQNARMLLPFRA